MNKEIEELKAEISELNDSVTWWTNRYNAVIRNNQQLKKQQKAGVEYIKENVYIDYYGVSVFREKDGVDKLLRMLGEKDGNT